MTDSGLSPDLLVFEDPGKKAIPSTLRILTLLTYIGCGLGFIGTVVQVFIQHAVEDGQPFGFDVTAYLSSATISC